MPNKQVMLSALAFHEQVLVGLQDAFLAVKSHLSNMGFITFDKSLEKKKIALDNELIGQGAISLDEAIAFIEERIKNNKT